MLVSVAIFAIVMTIALGSLLAMSESNRKAQSLKSVINNLNFALDSMSRSIRTGTTYHCDTTQGGGVRDCTNLPASSFSFVAADAATNVAYRLESADRVICTQPVGTVGCITRSINSGVYAAITSPEVVVSTLLFYVTGAESAAIQPKVTILLSGYVKSGGAEVACDAAGAKASCFNLQTSVTQRLYDF